MSHVILEKMLGNDAEGAYPCETKVIKTNSEEDDNHPDGTEGVIKGSYKYPSIMDDIVIIYCYLVKFENMTDEQLAFVLDYKLKLP